MVRVAVSPAVRTSLAALGAMGIVALAGCSSTPVASSGGNSPAQPAPTGASSASADSGVASAAATSYKDGSYEATGTYQTPESVETIDVTLTLKNDIVTAVTVTGNPQARESKQYQGDFIGGISAVVVGKDIDSLNVSRVAGSSLTSGGFNKALEKIKSEAKA